MLEKAAWSRLHLGGRMTYLGNRSTKKCRITQALALDSLKRIKPSIAVIYR